MFDWLFEKRVKAKVYFYTSYEERYHQSHEVKWNLGDILITELPAKERIWLRVNPSERSNKIHAMIYMLNEDMQRIIETEWNDKPVLWSMDFECWEGTWKKIKKLPWVTVTEEVLEA